MNSLQFSPLSQNDLLEIQTYIEDDLQNPSAAVNIIKGIITKIRKLIAFPYMGAPLSSIIDVETDYRYLICGNYITFYRYENDTIFIIRILYKRRDYVKILFGDMVIKNI